MVRGQCSDGLREGGRSTAFQVPPGGRRQRRQAARRQMWQMWWAQQTRNRSQRPSYIKSNRHALEVRDRGGSYISKRHLQPDSSRQKAEGRCNGGGRGSAAHQRVPLPVQTWKSHIRRRSAKGLQLGSGFWLGVAELGAVLALADTGT